MWCKYTWIESAGYGMASQQSGQGGKNGYRINGIYDVRELWKS